MNIFKICGYSTHAVVVPSQSHLGKANIKSVNPEQAHLFRMIDSHGKCQEVDIRMMNRIAMQRIEQQRRDRILSTFLQGMNDE